VPLRPHRKFDATFVLKYASTAMEPSARQSVQPNSAPLNFENELVLIAALRQGDEAAFMWLVDKYHLSLVRLATLFVKDQAVAEEVAQEAWIGVLRGIDRFEGRSSLKTWLYRILTNTAKTRAQRENRSIPFSALGDAEEPIGPSVEPDRFLPPNDPQWPNHWAIDPRPWNDVPEERFQSKETQQIIQAAIEKLPVQQREVMTLRDIEGWSSTEVCNALEISETNQRVLLHRARSKVRQALEQYFSSGE
jgi:RNA polymerase sigma-70 factor (ECF subfamily)